MGIDVGPELRLLDGLCRELAGVGVRAEVRRDLPAVAVSTDIPGFFVWVFVSPSGERYACHLNCLCEYGVSDPQGAAQKIAAFVRELAAT